MPKQLKLAMRTKKDSDKKDEQSGSEAKVEGALDAADVNEGVLSEGSHARCLRERDKA